TGFAAVGHSSAAWKPELVGGPSSELPSSDANIRPQRRFRLWLHKTYARAPPFGRHSCNLRPDRARSQRACSQISEGQSVETLDQISFDLLEDARDAVIVADRRSGGVRFWNPAARALLGYNAAEADSP